MITGLPAALHLVIRLFCITGIRYRDTWTPISPRATIMLSLASIILSMLFKASTDSILEIIRGSASRRCRISRAFCTSLSVFTIERATKSAPCSAANARHPLAFSSREGCEGDLPGVTTPLRSVTRPPATILQRTSSPSIFSTVSLSKPSSSRILPPAIASR